MDKINQYLNYSLDDFVEDEMFWSWVMKETPVYNVLWERFISIYPEKVDVIEEASKKVLQLNKGESSLSDERVSILWNKIIESKNVLTFALLAWSFLGCTF